MRIQNINDQRSKPVLFVKSKGLPAILCFLFVVFNISGCGNLPQGRYGQEAVKIAVMPAYSTAAMSAKYLPLLDRLSKETGYDVQYISAENLAGFGAAIENSGAQFVICDPLIALSLIKTKNSFPLVIVQDESGSANTFGLIVTTISQYNAGINEIRKLGDQTICCASRQSAEGYISQAKLLADSGIDPAREIRFVAIGQMDKVLSVLQSGKIAAGFIPGSLWSDSLLTCFRILGRGADVPGWVLVSLQGGHTELDEKIRDAVLSLNPAKEEDRKILLDLGIGRFITADVNQVEGFSRLADQMKIPY
jgi:ABC-type phosphate/phosphonate transport system substrate-binding protein